MFFASQTLITRGFLATCSARATYSLRRDAPSSALSDLRESGFVYIQFSAAIDCPSRTGYRPLLARCFS